MELRNHGANAVWAHFILGVSASHRDENIYIFQKAVHTVGHVTRTNSYSYSRFPEQENTQQRGTDEHSIKTSTRVIAMDYRC